MSKTKYLENLLRVSVYEKELLELENEDLKRRLNNLTQQRIEQWIQELKKS